MKNYLHLLLVVVITVISSSLPWCVFCPVFLPLTPNGCGRWLPFPEPGSVLREFPVKWEFFLLTLAKHLLVGGHLIVGASLVL